MQVSSTAEEHRAAQKCCSLPRVNLQFCPDHPTPWLSDPSCQAKSKQMWTRGHSSPALGNTAMLPAQHSVQRGVSSQLHWKLHTNYSAYYLSGSLLHSRFPSAISFSLAVSQLISHRSLHVSFAKGTLMATIAPYGYFPLAKPFVFLPCPHSHPRSPALAWIIIVPFPRSPWLPIGLIKIKPEQNSNRW